MVGYHIEERHDAVVVSVVNDGHDCYIVDIVIAVDLDWNWFAIDASCCYSKKHLSKATRQEGSSGR